PNQGCMRPCADVHLATGFSDLQSCSPTVLRTRSSLIVVFPSTCHPWYISCFSRLLGLSREYNSTISAFFRMAWTEDGGSLFAGGRALGAATHGISRRAPIMDKPFR